MNEKKYDIVIIRSNNSHWWGLENEPIFGAFRWTSGKADFQILNPDVTLAEIWIECHPSRCGEISISQNGETVVSLKPVVGKGNVIRFDVKSTDKFEISCQTFVPRDFGETTDPRSLGVLVRGFVLHTKDEQCMVEMHEIPIHYVTPGLDKLQAKFSNGIISKGPDYSGAPYISTPLKRGAMLYMDRPYPRLMKQLADYIS